IGDKEGIARAMDSLALTLREGKRYEEAYALYAELLKLQSGLKNQSNITQTQINLGYCANESDKLDIALDHLSRAEKRLRRVGDAREEESGETITLDLAGQGSAAGGFDITTKLILVETLRVDIFSKKQRFD